MCVRACKGEIDLITRLQQINSVQVHLREVMQIYQAHGSGESVFGGREGSRDPLKDLTRFIF